MIIDIDPEHVVAQVEAALAQYYELTNQVCEMDFIAGAIAAIEPILNLDPKTLSCHIPNHWVKNPLLGKSILEGEEPNNFRLP